MSEEEKIMLETNQSITNMETCFRNKIKELQQENKELHNKIDKLEDELNWYKQECDDLEMMCGDIDE